MGTLSDHVHIYVDASFEDGGYSRLGGALYDSKWNLLSFFSEQLDHTFLDQVKRDGEVSIIQEMEMLALLVAIELWCLEWNGHRVPAKWPRSANSSRPFKVQIKLKMTIDMVQVANRIRAFFANGTGFHLSNLTFGEVTSGTFPFHPHFSAYPRPVRDVRRIEPHS